MLILVLLLGGAAVAYLAWARGMLTLPDAIASRLPAPPPALTGQPVARLDTAAPGGAAASAITPQAATVEEDELLMNLADSREPRLRPLLKFGPQLRQLQGQLVAIQNEPAPAETDNAARDKQLGELSALYKALLAQYNAFEDAAAEADSPETADTLTGLRGAYEARLGQFLDLLGRVYVTDPQVERREYIMSDNLAQAVGARGHIDVEALHKHWVDAGRARQQRELDERYAEQYKAINARLATVHELRTKFNAAAQELGPLNMDEGRLTPAGAALLEMYDAYADKLEQLWADWKEYAPTLPPVSERPDGLMHDILQYTDLLKSEHLDCFTQMYRIYASDKDLKHPAYDHLRSHNDFVIAEWKDKVGAYEAVYTQYEDEWMRVFKGRHSSGGGGGFTPSTPPDAGGGSAAPGPPPVAPPSGGGGGPAPGVPPVAPPTGQP